MSIKVDSIDVANYVVWYTHSINNPINNIQLQKIMFFLNTTHESQFNTKLFDDQENIEFTKYGPLYTNIYEKFKAFGANEIKSTAYTENVTSVQELMKFLNKPFIEKPQSIPKEKELFIQKIIRELVDVSLTDLVNKSIKKQNQILKLHRN